MHPRNAVLCTALILLALTAPAAVAGEIRFEGDIAFTSADGTILAANLFSPVPQQAGQTFPAIIFINSWALDEHEYLVQAANFAHDGYLVLSYSSRGWGASGGLVSVAGPNDMDDLTAAVDWLLAETPVDPANIGACGISYGAGISLLGLAHDTRLKTAAAMSTYTNVGESLYGNNTPRLVWGGILVGSGYLTGHMDPIIAHHYGNILTGTDVDETLAWAGIRSAESYLDIINARNAPVYISQNFGDELFQPNSVMRFYEGLTGPKKMDLSRHHRGSARQHEDRRRRTPRLPGRLAHRRTEQPHLVHASARLVHRRQAE